VIEEFLRGTEMFAAPALVDGNNYVFAGNRRGDHKRLRCGQSRKREPKKGGMGAFVSR